MRRALGNLALAVGSLAVLLGAGEALLRAIPDPSDAARFSAFRPDGVLGYTLRPDVATVQESDEYRVPVHTNALGLRGRPATQEKPPGVRRILVLGDSFAFGFGVGDEETFSALLEARLAPRLGPVEVLNAGVPGWSADHHLVFLRTRGFDLAPDLVLVAQTENDPGDLGWNRLTLDERRLPVRVESTRRVIDHRGRMRYVRGAPLLDFPAVDWLSDHSYLFHWIRFRLAKLAVVQSQEAERRRREKAAEAPPAGPIEALPPEEVQRGLGTGRAFQLRYHRHLLAAIERECAEHAVALRVLLIAFRPGTQGEDDVAEALRADCAALGSRCLDTRGLFTPDEIEPAFFAKDGHWTPFGQRRVAEALAEWLAADPALAR